jgi:acyl-CoA dehydrogenase
VDFGLSTVLYALQAEARGVAATWRTRMDIPEDSWIVGTSRPFSLELAERGWLGMTWPTEEGGHGRSAIERAVVFEALISGGAPVATSWFADRQIGPTLLQYGTADQRRRFLPDIVNGR